MLEFVPCGLCSNSGECIECQGEGESIDPITGVEVPCEVCLGTGACQDCLGSGEIMAGEVDAQYVDDEYFQILTQEEFPYGHE